ncbi:TPA: hypothetical protein ACQWGN_001099 [Neisseria subflava]
MKPSLPICSLLLSCMLAAASTNSFAAETVITSPDKQFSVKKVCNHKNQECSFYAGKKAIEKNLPEDRTSYKWLGNTFALRTSFGSYDSYTTFADRTHKPQTLSSVIATDSKTQCAVTAGNKGVSFYSLFRDKPVKFIAANDKKFGFPQDVVSLESVVEVEFKGKKVHMTYMNKAERNVSVVLDNPCVK